MCFATPLNGKNVISSPLGVNGDSAKRFNKEINGINNRKVLYYAYNLSILKVEEHLVVSFACSRQMHSELFQCKNREEMEMLRRKTKDPGIITAIEVLREMSLSKALILYEARHKSQQ